MDLSSRKNYEEKILDKIFSDADFKKQFLKNPKTAVEEEFGISLPEKLKIKVIEEKPLEITIVIPRDSQQFAEDVKDLPSEKELAAIQGGISFSAASIKIPGSINSFDQVAIADTSTTIGTVNGAQKYLTPVYNMGNKGANVFDVAGAGYSNGSIMLNVRTDYVGTYSFNGQTYGRSDGMAQMVAKPVGYYVTGTNEFVLASNVSNAQLK